jgi:UDP-4-amino-4,6-dideoxy-L-N-acetyl-beta-L-altrosamine transaminase
MSQKFIPYGKQTIDKADIKAVSDVLKTDWITQGPKVGEFEKALAGYCGAKYAVAVSNGTAALHIACLAAGLKKGDEAITTPITFAATSNSVLYTGAKPVFADVEPDTANISLTEIKKNLTSRTKVILPVDYAGLPCDIAGIWALAKKKGLTVIQDGCHALGAEYRSKGKGKRKKEKWLKVGCCEHADMTVFSFHPVKSITTGEGGAVLTKDKRLYEKLSDLRTHGITKENSKFKNRNTHSDGEWYNEMQALGFNYRSTDIQCALGISQLGKLDGFIKRRREIASEYSRCFSGNPFFDIPVETAGARSAWHLYAIRLKDRYVGARKEIFETLRARGIGAQVHYVPVHLHPYYRSLGYKKGLCPWAERFYKGEISLPIYPLMTKSDRTTVVETVIDIFNERGI